MITRFVVVDDTPSPQQEQAQQIWQLAAPWKEVFNHETRIAKAGTAYSQRCCQTAQITNDNLQNSQQQQQKHTSSLQLSNVEKSVDHNTLYCSVAYAKSNDLKGGGPLPPRAHTSKYRRSNRAQHYTLECPTPALRNIYINKPRFRHSKCMSSRGWGGRERRSPSGKWQPR